MSPAYHLSNAERSNSALEKDGAQTPFSSVFGVSKFAIFIPLAEPARLPMLKSSERASKSVRHLQVGCGDRPRNQEFQRSLEGLIACAPVAHRR